MNNQQTLFEFYQFSQLCLIFGPGFNSGFHCMYMLLDSNVLFPQSFFVFYDLGTFEEFWWFCFVNCPSIWIHLVFSYDYIGVTHLTRIPQKWYFALLHAVCQGAYDFSVLLPVILTLVIWISCVCWGYYKFTAFPFVINKCLVGRYSDYTNVLFYNIFCPINFRFHQWFLPLTITTVVFV